MNRKILFLLIISLILTGCATKQIKEEDIVKRSIVISNGACIKINLDEIDGISILKDKDYNLKLEVDLTKKSISDAIKLLDPDKIIDINISNTPLEQIISNIYKGNKK